MLTDPQIKLIVVLSDVRTCKNTNNDVHQYYDSDNVCMVDVEHVGSHECDFPVDHVQDLPMLTSSTISFTTSSDVDRQVREHLNTGQGLYSVDAGLLSSLRPDVIVTQSLCKVCSVDFCLVEKLALDMECQPKVVDTNPQDLEGVLSDIERIGKAIGLEEAGLRVRRKLEDRVERVVRYVNAHKEGTARPRVLMMEWTDPIFVGGHWTPQIIHMAGGEHPLNLPESCSKEDGCWGVAGAGHSFTVTPEQVAACDPDVVIIAPCGLDMTSTIRETRTLVEESWWKNLKAVREGRVWLVDGNHMFNRPGPRLVDALEWICWILHGFDSSGSVENFPAKKLEDISCYT